MNFMQLIIYFFGELYAVFSLVFCYHKISGKEINRNFSLNSILIYIIVTIIFLMNNLYNFSEYRTIMSLIIMIFMNYIFFKDNIKNVVINTIIYLFAIIVFEVLFSGIILTKFANIESLNTDGTIVKLILTFLVFTIANIFFSTVNKKMIEKIKSFSQKYITVEILLISIIIILNLMTFLLGEKINNFMYMITTLIIIIYAITTIVMIVKNKYNIEKLKAKNEEITESYKAYSLAFDEFRTLKHNLKNELFSLKASLPKEKHITINEIINKYNNKYKWLNTLENIPEGLEGVIYLKKKEAEKEKVKLVINYKSKQTIREKDFLDICDILGIYLDNAIEANKSIKNKIVLLDVFDEDNYIIMRITNNFTNTIDLNKIGDKNYSTKTKKSGIGLNFIKKIKNKNILTELRIVNKLFVATIKYRIKKEDY